MNRRWMIRATLVSIAGALLFVSACAQETTAPSSITRERAIEIARQQITFTPTSTDAVLGVRDGKQVWVVTFRAADGSHGGLGQFMEVTIDSSTGQVVTVARS